MKKREVIAQAMQELGDDVGADSIIAFAKRRGITVSRAHVYTERALLRRRVRQAVAAVEAEAPAFDVAVEESVSPTLTLEELGVIARIARNLGSGETQRLVSLLA